jgi:HK97 family phage major capsid protein
MAKETNDEGKSWTPEKLLAHIKDVCGSIVTEKLAPLQQTVKDQGTWLTANKEGLTPAAIERTLEQKGLTVGGIIAAVAASKALDMKPLEWAKTVAKDEMLIKALEASTGVGGGFLVTPEVSSDFIDLLTPRAVVRSFGTPVIPMSSGTMTISKLTAASAAYYIGENKDMVKSQQSFGVKKLTARKLAVLVPISNDLLRRGGPKVSAIVRNDALRSAALKEDVTFLRAQGTEFTPKGLRYLAAAANILTANATVNLVNTTYDLGRMVLQLEESNVAFTNPGWVFAPRTAMYLMTVRDGLGNYAFRGEMMTGKLWGYPFKKTTQVPRNLGTGGDESEIYFADFDDVAIGQTLGLDVAVSTEASYKDENGDLVSAFSLDQTVMRLIMEHDLALRHDESVTVMTEVKWVPTGA